MKQLKNLFLHPNDLISYLTSIRTLNIKTNKLVAKSNITYSYSTIPDLYLHG